ncbi:hypothetical protein [Antarctobacter heliothermus]|uniref:Transferrin-binding protein B C-lobe/N-lobe beta barrel domain-containing protein n=1 Tax=Antarctobacter heliothermus TaxID=74033 RepID=A0A239C403_9RHOB|nr:hypothetical protein [Antarctobacter heliothermus]SNS14987.1 hypothetical protein SAMN04488078_1005112 [Antarctobacter heliothermus]
MYRTIVALALASALAACDPASLSSGGGSGIGTGAQPLIAEPEAVDGGGAVDPDADPDPDNLYTSELKNASADLTVNEMTFDPATGELVFNNLPFDSNQAVAGENVYTRDPGVSAALAGRGFDAYRNAAGPNGGSQYFAVFRRSPTGFSQVGAVGSDRYLSFGFGGAAAQRLDGKGALPDTNDSYVFTGEYAAVRTVVDDTTGTRMEYVSGVSLIDVDIQDFDVSGAVEGLIVSREFFDVNGVNIADLSRADFLSLSTAQINFDTWTISSSDASAVRSDGEVTQTGSWSGLFAGPNGEEVVGVVVVEGQGPVGIDPATGEFITQDVREVGGFIATRP